MALLGERARAESGFLLLYSERDKPGSARKSAHDGIVPSIALKKRA
jgi:hypothetical protein